MQDSRATWPLGGVTVVSLEHAVAAPFATRQLADLGARVIKVERPGTGDFARQYDESVGGMASYFVWLNRSKESVTLDFKTAAGREVLQRLIGSADVVVQNLAPGAAERLGVGAELRRHRPEVITVAVTGYGSSGPWATRKAYDALVQSEAGLISMTGSAEEPAKVGISVADIAAGMYAFSGTLAALYRRQATGQGSSVEVSLFEALAEWMGQPLHYVAGAGRQPPRTGAHHASIAPYGPFRTSDGSSVFISVQNDREWRQLCSIFLEDSELASDPRFESNTRRVERRRELDAMLDQRFALLDAHQARALLDQAGVANARVNDVEGLRQHPVLRQRGRWHEVQTPVGPVEALRSPIDLNDAPPRMDAVPALGEHTESVLVELGYSPGQRNALRSEGAT